MNTATLPTTIDAYLDALRAALPGPAPALVQDALYDAEEYLRTELAEQAGQSRSRRDRRRWRRVTARRTKSPRSIATPNTGTDPPEH